MSIIMINSKQTGDYVNFITYKMIETDDFLEYKYNIINFDKII